MIGNALFHRSAWHGSLLTHCLDMAAESKLVVRIKSYLELMVVCPPNSSGLLKVEKCINAIHCQ